MDEAASKIRMEIDSMPAELDEISRKIMQLEIEKQALGKEEDNGSKMRLQHIEQELAELKNKNDAMRAQWETEKQSIAGVKRIKQEIEDTKHQMEEAERQYDLEKMAQLKFGTLPALEKQLEEERQRVDAGKDDHRARRRSCCACRRSSTSGSSARTRPSPPSARPSSGAVPG